MSDLNEQLDQIITAAEPKAPVAEKPIEAEVKTNNEESGVDAAETSSNEETTESTEEGGEEAPSDELDEEFKNLDPEVREALSKADADTRKAQANAFKKMRASFDKKFTELGQEKKLAETTKQIFSKLGIDPSNGLSRVEKLLQFESELDRDPEKVINLLRQKFNLKEEKSGSEKKLDESLLTDEEKILNNKIEKIEKRTEEFLRLQETELKRREQEEIQRARIEIDKFKNQTNEDGSLKNPYFDDLIDDIGKLTELYPNENIEKLYTRALRNNDDFYNKSLEDIKKQEREKILRERKAQVEKANKINAQTSKSSPKSAGSATLDDILSDVYDNASKMYGG